MHDGGSRMPRSVFCAQMKSDCLEKGSIGGTVHTVRLEATTLAKPGVRQFLDLLMKGFHGFELESLPAQAC